MMAESAFPALVLRREAYGGFVFHPSDATFVHLDKAGFAAAEDLLLRGRAPEEGEARAFVRALRAELPSGKGPARLVNLPPVKDEDLAGLFSAPTLVDFQITDRCGQACPQCYASAHPDGRHAAWEDVRHAFREMRAAGVCQVALGGGEPLRHPQLPDILALARDCGMVPNVTTTGVGMTAGQLRSLARHAGAVALSLEGVGERFSLRRRQGFAAFGRAAEAFLGAGVPLVLQVTLSAGNLGDLPDIVDYALGLAPLYGVIFLAHKPVGRAAGFDAPLAARSFAAVYRPVLAAAQSLRTHTRVGFDCCLSPLVAALEEDLGFPPATVVEGCSATRGSLGLSPSLDVVPCTFLSGESLGNLGEQTLAAIWRGAAARRFRRLLRETATRHPLCAGCGVGGVCLGGCPVWSLVGCRRKMLS